MTDIPGLFADAFQGSAALKLAPNAQDFSRAPGALSGLRLIDTAVATIGIERISGQLAKYAVKLALKSDNASEKAAREMVDLMRSRVPQDTGLLLNGITYRREGKIWIVEATADRGGYDYALAVEAGHHAGGQHADADFFEDTTGRGGRQVYESHETDVPGQPYFYNSAREALSDWAGDLRSGATTGAREEGL